MLPVRRLGQGAFNGEVGASMRIIGASYDILQFPEHALTLIELAGRTCYKSEAKMTGDSSEKFAGMILGRGHESVIEHVVASVKFTFDRGVSHEMVRHRLCAFSQESTRFCDYMRDQFGSGITYIKPFFWTSGSWQHSSWLKVMRVCEEEYLILRAGGEPPERARSVLPQSLKTEIVVTANFREWRHIFRLRTAKAAHPQMREVMVPCLDEFARRCPSIFGSIEPYRG